MGDGEVAGAAEALRQRDDIGDVIAHLQCGWVCCLSACEL